MAATLKDIAFQGRAAFASYTSATFLINIPTSALSPAQFTCRNEGTAGNWYVIFHRSSGPSTTLYSKKLGPGEPFTEPDPPVGDIYLLADGSANGVLSWYLSYK